MNHPSIKKVTWIPEKAVKLSDKAKAKMHEYGIPDYMHDVIIRYYERGIPPGHFLTAVIDNDLRGAIERADDTNVMALKAYVMWFYNQAPSGSWGKAGSVARWVKAFEESS